jgi:hypothetical protein
MATKVIEFRPRRHMRRPDDLTFCPFDLVPGANGRVLMWWREEKTWIAAFPSPEAAHDFIIGHDEGWPRNPGWDRSDTSIDLKPALYEYRELNGKFPQFEFSENSNVFDLYTPLGLGPEALSRLIYHTTYAAGSDVDQGMIDEWCPLVAQVLSGGGWKLEPELVARIAPVMTETLLRTTKHQIELGVALDDQRLASDDPTPL